MARWKLPGLVGLGIVGIGVLGAAIVMLRRAEPEPTWEPGLEFNPDYRPSAEEIRADLFGDPTAVHGGEPSDG